MLVLELIPGPARARSQRASALNHEVRDHAMKRQAVVEAALGARAAPRVRRFTCAFGEPHEVFDGSRRVLGKEAASNPAGRGFKNRIESGLQVAHQFSLLQSASKSLALVILSPSLSF